ncbi:MAG: hypothetical protein EA424_06075 [Planctomycetaceae bacterium]|nr:MAG: hypothetical protein EA424_06075 [Planctomycetaceae bacterium]
MIGMSRTIPIDYAKRDLLSTTAGMAAAVINIADIRDLVIRGLGLWHAARQQSILRHERRFS